MEERHKIIAEIIRDKGKITIAEITSRFDISDESARRDLRLLEQKGECKRTHGGAILPTQVGIRPPVDRKYSEMPVFDNYRKIAEIAAEKILENDIIYLTSGSFGHIMLLFLPKNFHYTVVVNHVELACELRCFDNIDVYTVGGRMRKSGSIVDSFASDFITRMHFDKCFVTGSGLTAENGLSNGTDETAAFQRAVINNSRKSYLLMPSSKIGFDAFIKVCDVEVFEEVITDSECHEDHVISLEERGLCVTISHDTQ